MVEGFWTDGYFANTISKNGSKKAVATYVSEQGTKSQYK